MLLLGITFLFDYAIGTTLKHYYFTQTSGAQYRTTYSMDSTNAQVLIFGSSRANHHYNPSIIENMTGMSCYNTGRDGNFLLYNYAIFKTVINRYKPEIVIIDVEKDELSSTIDDYERLSSLLPYLNRNKAIDQTIALRGPYEKIKCLSKIYPYNSLLLTIAIGNTELNKARKPDIKGYVPLNNIWDNPYPELDSMVVKTIDQNKKNALLEIIQDCKLHGIRLVLVISPLFIKSVDTTGGNPVMQIALKNNVEYLDFTSDTIFLNNHHYFTDPEHLNESGATLFSTLLIEHLLRGEK
ncbi:MAG TPA: hypothetical protein PLW31_03670 [Bacteroidales bacterium]|nr:hypothetical protein [Bacteroidales bacterium]HPM91246.1 hypothetical protein [Bacteroidales bacterium]